jgi:hypothetical protein
MWAYEYSAETAARPAAIWRRWADVATWGAWNGDIESVTIDGPFAPGAVVEMCPKGQDPVRLRLADVVPGRQFVDEAEFGDILLRTTHRIDPLPGDRYRVTYRMEISGPGSDEAGPELGPAITGDFGRTVAALLALALADTEAEGAG